MLEIRKAADCGDSLQIRKAVSDIFVDGFYQWLHYFSKSQEQLAQAFAHIFQLELFYVALEDGVPVGIAALTDGVTPCIRFSRQELKKHLGFWMGTIAYAMLKRELEDHQYPFVLPTGSGSVEFVSVHSVHRGKKAASTLLRHMHETTGYADYVLEVADTNSPAVRLYKSLGYREFQRVPEKHPKQSGVNFLVYMRYEKGNTEL